jgi:hypothetical protein
MVSKAKIHTEKAKAITKRVPNIAIFSYFSINNWFKFQVRKVAIIIKKQ